MKAGKILRTSSITLTKYFFFSCHLTLLPFKLEAQVNPSQVDQFINRFAAQYNKPVAEVKTILADAQFQPDIIQKMERPAEGMSWFKYRGIFLTEERIQAGVDFWEDHYFVLGNISEKYGVPEEIILGILGVETYFGQRKGTYKVLDALYTLGFGYPRRSKFFQSELEQFLLLLEEEELDPDRVLGSYAGAIGYCQFMPSSYRAYAMSFEKNSNKDIVTSPADAMASIANYLKVHRWKPDPFIAVRTLRDNNVQSLQKQSLKPKNSVKFYEDRGYIPLQKVPSDLRVTLQEFEMEDTQELWFCFDNFYVITRYNHSPLYAMAVFQLGSEIKKKKELLDQSISH